MHWDKVSKDATFAPKERWRSWSADQVQRFDWIAGEQLANLGYETSRTPFSMIDSVTHTARDWRWLTARTIRRFVYRARVRLALRSRIAHALGTLGVRPAARSNPHP